MRSTVLTGLLGLVIGALLVGGGFLLLGDDDGDTGSRGADTGPLLQEAPPRDPDAQVEAARAFLRDWLRFREATFFVRSDFERTTDDGEVLRAETTLAQDPPNRISTRLGGVTGVVDGRPVSCLTPPGEEQRCVLAEYVSDYDADVRTEIETMATYFAGSAPLYTIAEVGSCYEVVLTRYVPAAPYGFSGSLCFDQATGVLVETRFDFEGLVERTVAVEISPSVPDGTFDVE